MRTITLRKLFSNDGSGDFARYEAQCGKYKTVAFTPKFAVANVCFNMGIPVKSKYFVRFLNHCGRYGGNVLEECGKWKPGGRRSKWE